MATVHPSRMGLVPGARSAATASSGLSGTRSRDSPPPPPPPPVLSREEELKMRLLAKRRDRDGTTATTSAGVQERTEKVELLVKGRAQIRSRSSDSDRYGRLTRSPSPPPPSSSRREDHTSSRAGDRDDASRVQDRGNGNGRDDSPRRRVREEDRRPSPSYRPRPPSPSRHRGEGLERSDTGSDRRREEDGVRGNPGRRSPGRDGREGGASGYGYGGSRRDIPRSWGDGAGPPPAFPPFPPTGPISAPGSAPGSGYNTPPMRLGFGGGGGGGYDRRGGAMDFERRRLERINNPLSIWPPSPKRPYVDEDDLAIDRKARKEARKKSKRRRRYSDSESDTPDSEEDRRRRRKEKDKDRRRKKRESYTPESDGRQRHRRGRSTSAGWVEKDQGSAANILAPQLDDMDGMSSDDDEMVGPTLPKEHKDTARRANFRDMLPGEAAAMAAYAATGQRIPRRGEIGLEAEQIEKFEESGYVMSGNRHRRMNAVRLRKENQVINAEEKRAILNLQREEKIKKEGAIISQFKEVIDTLVTRHEAQKR